MIIKYLSSKISIGIIIAAGVVFLFPHCALADTTGIRVSPATFKIETKPPADVWTPFIVENTSDEPVTLQVGYKLFNKQASENGKVFFLQNGQSIGPDKEIFEKMQIVDDENISHDTIDLGPQQKERYRLRITLPSNEPTGDYYFSLILLTKNNNINQIDIKANNNNQTTSSSLLAGIGMNIFLAVGDEETPQATLTTFSTPRFQEKGPVLFTLTVQNTGMHFITPHGTIVINNIFNQSVGRITLPPSIILAGTQRTFLNTIWSEKFLLGMYTGNLSLSLSDDGPTYTRTIHFFAVPLLPLVISLIVIIIITLISLRIKRMMK